jgi:hypothetical protein
MNNLDECTECRMSYLLTLDIHEGKEGKEVVLYTVLFWTFSIVCLTFGLPRARRRSYSYPYT